MTVRNLLHRMFLATLLLATGCDALFGDRQSSALGSGDGGTCLKNEATLAGLLTRAQRCDTLACPSGSHCNADFLCDWECFKDSDCGVLGRCSCDGRCMGTSPEAVSDAGSGDQSCERVRSKLLDLRTSPRTCTYEEECPHGARCDSLSRACVWDCLGTADPEFPCTAGTECSCQGLCVLPSAAPATPAPASELPRLEVEPRLITLLPPVAPATDWTPRRIDFRLTTLNRKLFESGVAKPKILVKASAGLGVVCSETGRDTVNYPSSCELLPEGWTPEAWGTGLMASRYLWVRPHAGATQTKFELTIASNGIANAHLTVNLDVFTPPAAAPVPTTPQDGVYSGSILLEGVGTAVASLGPQQIPVTVWKKGTTFLFHDDLRQVSPTGKLRLQGDVGVASSTFPTPYFVWLTGSEAQHSSGYMLASATMSDLAFVGQSESLSGKIAVKVDASSLSWTFQLRRTGSLPTKTCTSPGQCARGESCDSALQLCAPGDAWESVSYLDGNPTNFLVQEQAAPWRYGKQVYRLFSSDQVSSEVLYNIPGEPSLAGIAESALCYDADDPQESMLSLGVPTEPRLNIRGLEGRILETSGDLRCAGGRAPRGAGLFTFADEGNPGDLRSGDMLRTCLGDLARPPAIDEPTLPLADRAKELFFDDRCISLSRFFAALGVLPGRLDAYRPRDIKGETGDGRYWMIAGLPIVKTRWGGREFGLYKRLLGQWLDLHSFIARAGLEETALTRALGSSGSTETLLPSASDVSVEALLTQMESAWNLLLEKETAARGGRMFDYRHRGPLAYWTFDPADTSGSPLTTARDQGGYNTLAVSSGAPTAETVEGRGGLLWPSKDQSHALRRASQSLSLDGELAVSYWIRVDGINAADESDAYVLAVNAYAPTASPAVDQSSIEVGMFLDTSGKVGFFAQHKGKSDTVPERTTWPYRRALGGNPVHVVIVRAREDLTTRRTSYVLYVDGVRQTDGVESGTFADFGETFSTDIYIGRHNGTKTGAYWQGLLDDVAIWERPLGQADVTKLYGFGRAGSTDDPALLIPFAVPNKTHHEQFIGLSVKMLETMSSHLGLLRGYVQDVSVASYAESVEGWQSNARNQALRRIGSTLRYAQLVEGLATTSYGNVGYVDCVAASDCSAHLSARCIANRCVDPTGAWVVDDTPRADRWQRAREEFASLRSQVVDQALALQHLQNPLGIEENDLPLFFGDPQGANSRFFAGSDYLLNTWVGPAVANALSALDAARGAWLNQRNSKLQDQVSADDAERRVEGLQTQYGKPIVDACGLDVSSWDVFSKFESGELTQDNCFVDKERPECVLEVALPTRGIETEAVGYNLCLILDLAHKSEVHVPVNKWAAYAGIPFEVPPENLTYDQHIHLMFLQGNRNNAGQFKNVRYYDGTVAIPKLDSTGYFETTVGEIVLFRRIWEQTIMLARSKQATEFCQEVAEGRTDCFQNLIEEAETQRRWCMEQYSGLEYPLAALDPPKPESLRINACLRGKMGEATMAALGAVNRLNSTLEKWKDAEVLYRRSFDHCMEKVGILGATNALTISHQEYMAKLTEAKMYVDDALDLASMVTPPSTAGGAAAAEGAAAAGGAAATGGAGTVIFIAKRIAAHVFHRLTTQAENLYQKQLSAVQQFSAASDCWFEADKSRILILEHAASIQEAVVSLAIAHIELNNLKRSIPQHLNEAKAAVMREQGRLVPSLAHHYWLDEKIITYKSEFEWARRLTYLAMRAVEFEFQQSLPLRYEILGARNPIELQDAVRELQREQAARTINRRRPEESSLVLSLRDDVLKLEDHSDAPHGERRWTARKRFRSRLWSPENIIRDENGRYLGQGIRFAVSPENALELRCAERLWRVTATIQGDLLDVSQPEVPVLLMKSNTFSSQWCEGRGGADERYQVASIRPTSQLFRGVDQGGSEGGRKNYSSAFLTPWFNVRRGEFYKDLYREGASEELAGRGLYGEYVLLFPYSGLLEPKVGFPLDNVDDVLLRFDYLSVDDLPNLQ